MLLMLLFLIFFLFLASNLYFKSKILDFYTGKLPYECSFLSVSNMKVGYSAEFFLVVFCFMFFDLEIILIMPYLLSSSMYSNIFIFVLLLLTLILCYEILKGTFNIFS